MSIQDRGRAVLAYMWNNSEGGICAAAGWKIGLAIGLSKHSVNTSIAYLKDAGAIVNTERTNGSPGRWRILMRPEEYEYTPPPTFKYDWTPERLAAIPGLRATGAPTSVILKELGLPPEAKNALLGMVQRLGLPLRPSPIKRSGDGPQRPSHAKKPAAPKPLLPPLPSEKDAPLFNYTALPKPIVVALPKTPKVAVAKPPKTVVPKAPKPVVERPMLIDFRSSTPPRSASSRLYADGCLMGPSLNPCQFVVVEGSVITPWVHCGVDIVPPKPDLTRPFVRPLSAPYCAAHRRVCFYNPRVSQEAA